jgi:hypothetical protein
MTTRFLVIAATGHPETIDDNTISRHRGNWASRRRLMTTRFLVIAATGHPGDD